MTVTVEIDCDNAAFVDVRPGLEIARILHGAADKFDSDPISPGIDGFVLFDIDGNKVGHVEIRSDEDE